MSLERDLRDVIDEDAKFLGCFVAWIGQRKSKGAGTTPGYPDGCLFCAGQAHHFELKRTKDADNRAGRLRLDQQVFIERASEQGVTVPVIDNEADFIRLVNSCRAGRGR